MPKGDRATLKQKAFTREYVANKGNGTAAVLASYDTTDPKTACSIGTENLSKPVVQNELARLMKESNVTVKRALSVVSDAMDAETVKGEPDHAIRLRASDMSLKLHGRPAPRNESTL